MGTLLKIDYDIDYESQLKNLITRKNSRIRTLIDFGKLDRACLELDKLAC